MSLFFAQLVLLPFICVVWATLIKVDSRDVTFSAGSLGLISGMLPSISLLALNKLAFIEDGDSIRIVIAGGFCAVALLCLRFCLFSIASRRGFRSSSLLMLGVYLLFWLLVITAGSFIALLPVFGWDALDFWIPRAAAAFDCVAHAGVGIESSGNCFPERIPDNPSNLVRREIVNRHPDLFPSTALWIFFLVGPENIHRATTYWQVAQAGYAVLFLLGSTRYIMPHTLILLTSISLFSPLVENQFLAKGYADFVQGIYFTCVLVLSIRLLERTGDTSVNFVLLAVFSLALSCGKNTGLPLVLFITLMVFITEIIGRSKYYPKLHWRICKVLPSVSVLGIFCALLFGGHVLNLTGTSVTLVGRRLTIIDINIQQKFDAITKALFLNNSFSVMALFLIICWLCLVRSKRRLAGDIFLIVLLPSYFIVLLFMLNVDHLWYHSAPGSDSLFSRLMMPLFMITPIYFARAFWVTQASIRMVKRTT